MRRLLVVGVVVFVAAMFALAELTGGQGSLFLAAMVSAAGLLIVIVLLVAFSKGAEPSPDSSLDTFLAYEDAARHAVRGGLIDSAGDGNPASAGGAGGEAFRSSARAFVRALVPPSRAPASLSTASARREFLEALRKEGTGLIRLANVTGVDVLPYRAFLTDARKAALRGDSNATLRSLQLANEELRASIEKFLVKRKAAGRGMDEFLNL